MKNIFLNLLKVFQSPIGIISCIIGMMLIAIPSLYFLDKDLVIQNLGYSFYITEISLTVIITVLFGVFLAASIYKIQYFSIKKSGAGIVGGILGVVVSGCPACSITIASYIGLASIFSVFPYHGLELKILSVFLLLYACYATLKNLEVCAITRKK